MAGPNPPMMPHAAIQHWLDTVIKAQTLSDSPQKTCQLIREMPTPPASGRSTSPSKRRRTATEPDEGTAPRSDAGIDDTERTPRSQRLPYRPFEPPTLPASWSWSASESRPSASSSKQRRSVSPVKKMQNLWALQKPVQFVSMGDNYPTQQLPQEVQALHNRIRCITFLRSELLPVEVCDEVTSEFGYTVPDSWFRPATGKDASDSQDPGERRRRALAEFSTLCELLSTAQECEELGRSESSWNTAVHYPLLKLALAGHRFVEQEVVNTARIATPFIPPIWSDEVSPSVDSRMVDFALVLTPVPGRSRAKLRTQIQNQVESENARLVKAIDRVLLALPFEEQCVNQTLYTPLMKRPIAVSIETKVNGSADEGRIQLGIWVSAWHRRMRYLMRPSDEANQRSIVTLPLILVTDHQWQLMFACDRGDRLEVLEYIPIGDTNSLLGLYTIVAVLRELADWIEGPFSVMDYGRVLPRL